MKAYRIALISIAVVAMMCICPLAVMADDSDIRGFERFLRLYRKALPVHQAAVNVSYKE